MAEITDVQVVRWANERTRTLANKLEAAYYALEAHVADYAAEGIAAKVVAAGATDIIADGSAVDGRQRITGTSLVNLAAGLTQLKTAWDTTAVPGVGSSVKAILDRIQVDGSPR
jgi:hypothetical protein